LKNPFKIGFFNDLAISLFQLVRKLNHLEAFSAMVAPTYLNHS
jgi:hypothetical protein